MISAIPLKTTPCRRATFLRHQHSPQAQLLHWAKHLSRSFSRLGTHYSIEELLDVRQQAASDETIGITATLVIERSHRLIEATGELYHIASPSQALLCGSQASGELLGVDGLEVEDARTSLCPVCWQQAETLGIVFYGL